MSLVDIWKRTPEELRGKGIQQVLGLAGDGHLKDGNATSAEFREYLAHIPSDELMRYAIQCLSKGFDESGFALQDIANQIGKRLAFRVEDGRYRGSTSAIGFDGLWQSHDGASILVEVKTTDAYRLSLDTAANYRRELIRTGRISEDKSSILYIVGRADTGDLEAQIRGSRFAWDVRLISIEALLRLLKIKEELEDQRTVDRIRDILMPQEFTRVDGIINLVFSATTEAKPETPSEVEESHVGEKKGKKFTPVNFRPACVERLQRHFKESLVRQSAAVYATPDGSTAVSIAVSREYDWREGGRGYWFAFHPSQRERLEAYADAWVSFGCGSEKQMLVIPLKEFREWLPRFSRTESDDRFYWHVIIGKGKGHWWIQAKGGQEDVPVDKFLLGG